MSWNIRPIKTELGRVYFMTYRLALRTGEHLIMQEPFTGGNGAVARFVTTTTMIPADARRKLVRFGNTSWKDQKGTWIDIRVEEEQRLPTKYLGQMLEERKVPALVGEKMKQET